MITEKIQMAIIYIKLKKVEVKLTLGIKYIS